MKTSYFDLYKGENGVSISGRCPVSFKGEQYKKLAPKKWFFIKYKMDGDKNFYIQQYYKLVLDVLDPHQVYDDLKDKVILCWEKPGEFCHRRIVAEWIKDKLGIEVPEYIEPKIEERKFNSLFK